ncbi:MAG: hypothetical protein HN348_08240, partial [Proteobacteria bacterium]|nr:hypothetical protein [Pseudomonadota bacterium]
IAAAEHKLGISLKDLNVRDNASQLDTRALIVHDEDDRSSPLAHAIEVAEAWPGSELMITSGLGHRRILKDESVIGRVVAFLGSP